MHTHWCVLMEISMEIGMLIFDWDYWSLHWWKKLTLISEWYLPSGRSGGALLKATLNCQLYEIKSKHTPERINTGKPQSRRIFVACSKKMCSFFGHGFFFDRGRCSRSWCSWFFRFVLIRVSFGHNEMNATLLSFSSCQRNLIKTFQIEAMIALITKTALVFSRGLLNAQK